MFTVTQTLQNGCSLYVLQNSAGTLRACVNAADGMNVPVWEAFGHSLLHWDTARQTAGATYGVPVLYPTPNRVKDNRFCFEGKQVAAAMHGCVRNRAFCITELCAEETFARITGTVEFTPGSELFDCFPYASVLRISVTLSNQGLQWHYTVENHDTCTLPYSFALHPFFSTLGGARICANAAHVMESTPQRYPTGRLLPVEAAGMDLRTLTDTTQLTLDDVFCTDSAPQAVVEYTQVPLRLTLQASQEFSRLVVYTPPDTGWFCLENQTSSTDCHNLHAAGFVQAANLQLVPPGQTGSGSIAFCLTHLTQ